MYRDMDLIRKIVMHVRDHGKQPMEVSEYTPTVLRYHCWLVFDAKFADGADATLGNELSAKLYSLTWAGQNFADAASSDIVWAEAMKAIAKASTSLSFDALMVLLGEIGLERIRRERKR